jgi:hypothetical protein
VFALCVNSCFGKSLVAIESQWLSWEGTGFFGKTLVAKEIYGCHGKLIAPV